MGVILAVDWQPIILAVAGLVIGLTAPLAGLIVSLSNREKLSVIQRQTDGQYTHLAEIANSNRARIAALETAMRLQNGTPHTRIDDVPVVDRVNGDQAGAGISVPLWTQRNDPNPNGAQDAYWYEDCGEQCIAMVTYACRGVEVPQGVVRAQMVGPAGRGISTPDQLIRQLRRWHYGPTLHQGLPGLALVGIADCTAMARPVVALGHWLSPTLLHWVVVTGTAPDKVTVVDPWYGMRRQFTVDDWENMSTGTWIDVGEAAHYAS